MNRFVFLILVITKLQDFYKSRIVNMISSGKSRLIISVNDLRRENPKRTEQ